MTVSTDPYALIVDDDPIILMDLDGILSDAGFRCVEADHGCGSAWKRDPGSGVIGVEKGPLIPVV
ncbi:hypothetical protein DC429_16835 [Arthrobacter sp. TPD3018]|uniref:response regulator n=1 Tax=Bacteria TaxID=2 RepID=UPI000D50E9D5|nr:MULTISPECIES: response regulator [Bacteria]PVE51253.1 hypothetical protein DC425_17135 [Sphingomonas sp. TPD3009]PVE52230.1 hypothetical protein DC429_16835 [Arthrobacter sp. TPD3018]